MAKKKAQETIVLVRLPNAESKDGIGTLTIQRGDLGYLMEFAYRGLTLRGNIAEAVQNALIALAQLEASPPSHLTAGTSDGAGDEATAETPPIDEPDDDSDLTPETSDEIDSEITPEAPSMDEPDDDLEITPEAPPENNSEVTTETPPTDEDEVKSSPSLATPVVMNTTATSANQAQLSLI